CRIVVQVAGRSAIARAFGRFYEGEGDASDLEGSFKVVDASGNTVIRNALDVSSKPTASWAQQAAPPPPPAPIAAPVAAPQRPPSASQSGARVPLADAPVPPSGNQSAADVLVSIETAQRREVAALKAMVELLIEKGVFSREEY